MVWGFEHGTILDLPPNTGALICQTGPCRRGDVVLEEVVMGGRVTCATISSVPSQTLEHLARGRGLPLGQRTLKHSSRANMSAGQRARNKAPVGHGWAERPIEEEERGAY
eukprot:1587919-Rhodomonas_salina.2